MEYLTESEIHRNACFDETGAYKGLESVYEAMRIFAAQEVSKVDTKKIPIAVLDLITSYENDGSVIHGHFYGPYHAKTSEERNLPFEQKPSQDRLEELMMFSLRAKKMEGKRLRESNVLPYLVSGGIRSYRYADGSEVYGDKPTLDLLPTPEKLIPDYNTKSPFKKQLAIAIKVQYKIEVVIPERYHDTMEQALVDIESLMEHDIIRNEYFLVPVYVRQKP